MPRIGTLPPLDQLVLFLDGIVRDFTYSKMTDTTSLSLQHPCGFRNELRFE